MISKIQKLDRQAKFSLLTSTLALAIFAVLVLNILISIVYVLELIKEPNFNTIWVSFQDGYYTINDNKIGVSIYVNCLGVLFFWFLMVLHTLKSIKRSLSYIL